MKILIHKDKSALFYELGGDILSAKNLGQIVLEGFLTDFLDRIEFNKSTNLILRFYPLGKEKNNVVVDPKHQFGLPVIKGTNIQTATIHSLYEAGEKRKDISMLYEIPLKAVDEAILFYQKVA